jgi:hypothetical protein
MMILRFAGLGYMAYRRKDSGDVSPELQSLFAGVGESTHAFSGLAANPLILGR